MDGKGVKLRTHADAFKGTQLTIDSKDDFALKMGYNGSLSEICFSIQHLGLHVVNKNVVNKKLNYADLLANRAEHNCEMNFKKKIKAKRQSDKPPPPQPMSPPLS